MPKIKPRASKQAIFERLDRLVGPDAAKEISRVIEYLDNHEHERAILVLRQVDMRIGGYCGMPVVPGKPPGAYRPLGYVAFFLESPHPHEMARYIIDAIGQHVENLLQRISLLGVVAHSVPNLVPMGALVRSLQARLGSPLYDDLQWLASEVFNHAKHSVDVFHRPTPQERAHYFSLDEALAAYLIGRRLAVQLEEWSGKTAEQLMAEW